MADDIVGLDAVLFQSAALLDGSTVTPQLATWLSVPNARDVTTGLTAGLGDLSRRGTRIRQQKTTIQDWEIGFNLVWQSTDTTQQAIRDAFLNGGQVAMWVADGDDIIGSEGPAANWNVSGFTRNEPLEDGVLVDVVLTPYTFAEYYEKTS